MSNKGKRLVLCKKCKRKRFCTRVPIPGHNFRYTCNYGHSWEIEGVTVERIVSVMEEVLIPKLKGLFDRDDIFYKRLIK